MRDCSKWESKNQKGIPVSISNKDKRFYDLYVIWVQSDDVVRLDSIQLKVSEIQIPITNEHETR